MSKQRKFTGYEKMTVYAKANGRCTICGDHISYKRFTIDHKRPLCKGGTNDIRNLQAVCSSCNQMKHYLSWNEFMRKLLKVTLRNWKGVMRAYVKGGASL